MSKTCIILSVLLSVVNVVPRTIIDKIMQEDANSELESWIVVPGRRLFYETRCTRRFTPGVCVEPVAVVWSYVFQIQNCTQRLGCPQATRTNRFHSYRRCMRYCGVLADLYGQLLISDDHNDTDASAKEQPANFTARRESYGVFDEEETLQLEDEEERESIGLGDPPAFNRVEYDDEGETQELESILPPDIDYAAADRVPDQEDWFHDAFGRNYVRRRM